MAFELCWKCLKDFLEYKGVSVSAPRDVLKEAFKLGYLKNGQKWIDLLDKQNELAHIYNEVQAIQATKEIKENAHPEIRDLLEILNQQ